MTSQYRADSSRVATRTSVPHNMGKGTPSGVGRAVMRAIKEAGTPTHCGNCGGTHDLMLHASCEMLLCGDCRKLYVKAIASLTVQGQWERKLGIKGRICNFTPYHIVSE